MSDSDDGLKIAHDADIDAATVRIVDLAACLLSITAIVCTLTWWYIRTDKKDRLFRHRLIVFLLFFDLLKAVVLGFGPCWYIHNPQTFPIYPYSSPACDALGFFTSLAYGCVDFSNLLMAVNTAVSVFSNSHNLGVYPWRRPIFMVAFIFFPVLFAALGFVEYQGYGSGFTVFGSSCYLRVSPIWYRLALSWVPRLTILIVIAAVYIAIYVRLNNLIKALEMSFNTVNKSEAGHSATVELFGKPTNRVQRVKRTMAYHFPGLGFLAKNNTMSRKSTDVSQNDDSSDGHSVIDAESSGSGTTGTAASGIPTDSTQLQNFIHSDNYQRFQKSRTQMERHIDFVFVYPTVYFFLWILPLIHDSIYLSKGDNGIPPLWLVVTAAFMRAFSGFVDSIVWFVKELMPTNNGPQQTKKRPRLTHTSSRTRSRLSSKGHGEDGSTHSISSEATAQVSERDAVTDYYLNAKDLVAQGILDANYLQYYGDQQQKLPSVNTRTSYDSPDSPGVGVDAQRALESDHTKEMESLGYSVELKMPQNSRQLLLSSPSRSRSLVRLGSRRFTDTDKTRPRISPSPARTERPSSVPSAGRKSMFRRSVESSLDLDPNGSNEIGSDEEDQDLDLLTMLRGP